MFSSPAVCPENKNIGLISYYDSIWIRAWCKMGSLEKPFHNTLVQTYEIWMSECSTSSLRETKTETKLTFHFAALTEGFIPAWNWRLPMLKCPGFKNLLQCLPTLRLCAVDAHSLLLRKCVVLLETVWEVNTNRHIQNSRCTIFILSQLGYWIYLTLQV